MIENLVDDGTAQGALLAVYAEPPWLLHVSGELDLCSAPALTKMLEGPTKHGGTVGLDLAQLTYIDSSGLHVILNTVDLLGERGRVVLFNPSPVVRRVLEICGLDDMIEVSDHPSSAHWLDRGWSRHRPPGRDRQHRMPSADSSTSTPPSTKPAGGFIHGLHVHDTDSCASDCGAMGDLPSSPRLSWNQMPRWGPAKRPIQDCSAISDD